MSLVLPRHLIAHTFGEARGRGGRIMALVAIAGGLVAVGILAFAPSGPIGSGGVAMLPAAAALVAFGVVVVLLYSDYSSTASALYLLVGGAATFVYTATLFSQSTWAQVSTIVIALPKIALLWIGGGAGHSPWVSLGWIGGAWLTGEAAVWLANLPSSVPWRLDLYTTVFLLLVVSIVLLSRLWIAAVPRPVVPQLYRAVREDQLAQLRGTARAQSSALIHDIVLNRLAAIAIRGAGELDADERERIRAELAQLIGQDWLHSEPQADEVVTSSSGMHAVLDVAAADGLRIELSGTLDALQRLAPDVDRALSLAVRQCLVNVVKHSGQSSCEVAVSAVGDSVMVMVVDAGRGFDPDATDGDRLGLRQSVTARMADVGGLATIWSRPGAGTSVVLRAPMAQAGALA